MSDTFEKLKAIAVDKFALDPEKITLDSTLDELGIDSMDTFDMIFDAEDAFGIDIPDEQVDITCMRDVVALIDRFRQAQQKK